MRAAKSPKKRCVIAKTRTICARKSATVCGTARQHETEIGVEWRLEEISRVEVQPSIVRNGVVVCHLVRVPGFGRPPADTVQAEGEAENERAEQRGIDRGASGYGASQRLRRRRFRLHRWRQVKVELTP